MKTTNNYVWEKDLSLNDLVLKQKEEIERLNKKIEQYENPEDMTLMFMWCNEKAKDEIKRLNNIINELNNVYCKVITKCEEMINNRFYMNDIAIKKYANEIKDICKYYVGEAKRLKGSDKE